MASLKGRKYLIAVLKTLLKVDDLMVMKYTIESIIEELEDSNIEDISSNINFDQD